MKAYSLILLLLICCGFIKNSEPEIYILNATESSMHWTGYYVFNFGEHNGTVNIKNGELKVINNEIIGGGFEVDLTSMKNLDMKDDDGGIDLINHLKSEDFFAVDKYPKAIFKITQVEKITDRPSNGYNAEITGELTLKGNTNTLKFPASVTIDGSTIKAHSKFKFDRTIWGIKYNSTKFFGSVGDGAISDALGIELNLVATKNN